MIWDLQLSTSTWCAPSGTLTLCCCCCWCTHLILNLRNSEIHNLSMKLSVQEDIATFRVFVSEGSAYVWWWRYSSPLATSRTTCSLLVQVGRPENPGKYWLWGYCHRFPIAINS
jgi:hypothetical protein